MEASGVERLLAGTGLPERKASDTPGFVPRQAVVNSQTFGDTTLRILPAVQDVSRNASMIVGFPASGTGTTPLVTTSYLIAHLGLPVVAVLTNVTDMPAVGVVKGETPTPAVRIHGKGTCVVVVSELKIGAGQAKVLMEILEAVVSFGKLQGCNHLYVIDGFPLEELDQEKKDQVVKLVGQVSRGERVLKEEGEDSEAPPPTHRIMPLRYLTTCRETAVSLTSSGHEPLHNAVFQGLTGIVVAEMSLLPCPVTCLFCPVSAMFPDVWGAVGILQVLVAQMGWAVDVNPLAERAEALDARIVKSVVEKLDPTPLPTAMYS